MTFDLNILSVLEERPTQKMPFHNVINYEVRNKGMNDLHKGYNFDHGWRVMGAIPGFWYYFFSSDEGENVTEFCDFYDDNDLYEIEAFSELKINEFSLWKGGLKINDPYIEYFLNIFDHLLYRSPIKTVAFLARYQDNENEIVLGTFSKESFFKMLAEGQICFNVCYIVSLHGIYHDPKMKEHEPQPAQK